MGFNLEDLKKSNLKVKAIELSVLVILAGGVAYLSGVIDLKTMLTLTGFFGFGSISALRALFLEKGAKTHIGVGIAVLVTAVFQYGFIENLSWATPEKLQTLLEVLAIPNFASLLHGVAKSNGNMAVGS